jgi:hypothetical protein
VALKVVLSLQPFWVSVGLLPQLSGAGDAAILEERAEGACPRGHQWATRLDHFPKGCRADWLDGALSVLVPPHPPTEGEANPDVGVHRTEGPVRGG